jgi:hypothetical protein
MSILNTLKSYVSGDIKQDISVYVSDKNEEHKEGDVWEENNKSWTIVNGIQKSVSKLSKLRQSMLVPISCPKCNNAMTKRLDSKFYSEFGMCMDCRIMLDTEMIISGEFDEYQKEYINKNKIGWFKDFKSEFVDIIDKHDKKHIVNEFGDTEDWVQNMSKEELKELIDTQISQIEEKLFKE